jgi:hypothetical protein
VIPLAGHAKGGLQYAFGQNEKGDNAMKAQTRSTAVIAGGVQEFAVGGPAGAAGGGIAGGLEADSIITGEFLHYNRIYFILLCVSMYVPMFV